MNELLKIFEFTAEQAQQLARTQTVVGDAMEIQGMTVIPIYKLSCGFAGGGTDLVNRKKKDTLAAGSGAKVTKTPLSFLVIDGEQVQMLHVSQEPSDRAGVGEILAAAISAFREKQENSPAL